MSRLIIIGILGILSLGCINNDTGYKFILNHCYEDMKNFHRFKVTKMNNLSIYRELYIPKGREYTSPHLTYEKMIYLKDSFIEVKCNE